MWKSRLYSADPKFLLARECNRSGVAVQSSRTFFEKAGNGVFLCRSLGERNVVGSHYGLIAYGDLGK